VLYLAVMRRLQSQTDEIGNLELALVWPQAAEIEIWLHGAIFAKFSTTEGSGKIG